MSASLLVAGCGTLPDVSVERALLVWDGVGTCDHEQPVVEYVNPVTMLSTCRNPERRQGARIRGCFGHRDGEPRIWLSEGLDPLMERDVFAHELAHWLMSCGEYYGEDHGPEFHRLWLLILGSD